VCFCVFLCVFGEKQTNMGVGLTPPKYTVVHPEPGLFLAMRNLHLKDLGYVGAFTLVSAQLGYIYGISLYILLFSLLSPLP